MESYERGSMFGGYAMTRIGTLISTLIILVFASPSHALTFQFSFANIHGFISGLEDNTLGQAADSVAVTVSPSVGGLGEYAPGDFNTFNVSSGAITGGFFQGDSATHHLVMNLGIGIGILTLIDGGGLGGDISFSLVAEQTPLPAALPLFTTGLGALGLLGWRRKRKQAA
jgi:hypothetical protein